MTQVQGSKDGGNSMDANLRNDGGVDGVSVAVGGSRSKGDNSLKSGLCRSESSDARSVLSRVTEEISWKHVLDVTRAWRR